MSVQAAQANVKDALKALRQRWERARTQWNDDASRQFAEDVIDPIDGRVSAAVKGMERLTEIIAAVRRDCGDDAGE